MVNQRKTPRNYSGNIIPYGHQYLDLKDTLSVIKTLWSNWLTQGPTGPDFEKALAKIVGARYAVVVSSGTAALHLAYLASKLKAGDEVITTPNTFVATSNMLLALGVKPVFCDIREDNSNIDESKIESLITEKTKAIVPVHFAGHPCVMEKIWDIAYRHNLIVIEDAAHALGAYYKNQPIGGGKSSMTIFSFHPVKSITTGEGGAIVTNSQELYEKLKLLRSHGVKKDEQGFNIMTDLGFNYRLSDINSALGISQLKKLKSFIERRRELVKLYFNELKNIPEIILPVETEDVLSSWHLFVIKTKNPKDRLPLYEYLKQSGIGVNFHYPPVYSHPYYRNHGFEKIELSIANSFAKTAITLPLHPLLTEKQIKFISQSIKNFFSSISSIHDFNQLAVKTGKNMRSGQMFSFKSNSYSKIASDIIEKIKLSTDDNLLDAGGGAGDIALLLSTCCQKITVLDGSSYAIDIAQKNINSNHANFIVHDLENPLPFKDNEFSAIVCYSVIHYLKNKESFSLLLKEFLRILSPNGRLLIGDIPLKDKYEKNMLSRQTRPFYNFLKNTQYLLKKYITDFFYRYQRLVIIPKLRPQYTKSLLEDILKNHSNIEYQFLLQPKDFPFSDSREDLLIKKCS